MTKWELTKLEQNPRRGTGFSRAADANFRIMAESARRAVLTASPFEELKPYGDDYEQWRDITMTFEPPV